MSYEGYREYLCRKGHYSTSDAYEDDPTKCERCGADIDWRHSVDQTNGVEEDNPSTIPAPKEKVGQEDDWQRDHHGNKYAVAVPIYRPASGEWRLVQMPANT